MEPYQIISTKENSETGQNFEENDYKEPSHLRLEHNIPPTFDFSGDQAYRNDTDHDQESFVTNKIKSRDNSMEAQK